MEETQEERWLTGKQLRMVLNISKNTMHKYIDMGLFPNAYRLPAAPGKLGEWRISISDVEAFTATHKERRSRKAIGKGGRV